jgi:hypothetical protein
MKLREWLEAKGQNEQATFVIAKAVKDEQSPMYRYEYRETPIRTVWEWLGGETADKYIVINPDHPPIDIAGHWVRHYNKGWLKCCVITTEQDLYTKYSEKQAKEMLEWYDKEVRK